jgi:hypothetical protein
MMRSSRSCRESVSPSGAAYGAASSTRGFTPGPTRDRDLRCSTTAVTTLSAHRSPQRRPTRSAGPGPGPHTVFPACRHGSSRAPGERGRRVQPVAAVRARTGANGPSLPAILPGVLKDGLRLPGAGNGPAGSRFLMRGPLVGRLTPTPPGSTHGSDDGRARTSAGGCP